MKRGAAVSIAVVAAIVLAATPASGAIPKPIKLNGTVTGFATVGGSTQCQLVSFKHGKKNVGSARLCGNGLSVTEYGFTGNCTLKIGPLQGKLKVSLIFRSTGDFNHPTPAKYGTGNVIREFNKVQRSESIRVPGSSLPKKKGGKFTLYLSGKVDVLRP